MNNLIILNNMYITQNNFILINLVFVSRAQFIYQIQTSHELYNITSARFFFFSFSAGLVRQFIS